MANLQQEGTALKATLQHYLSRQLSMLSRCEDQMRVALVSCVKAKRSTPSAASDLYTSPLFRGLRDYPIARADQWFILSAEHGLLHPDAIVEPYERTLNRMRKVDRLLWAERVRRELSAALPKGAEVLVLAGMRYREYIVSFLREGGFSVSIPLEGKSIGRQLQWLKRENAPHGNGS